MCLRAGDGVLRNVELQGGGDSRHFAQRVADEVVVEHEQRHGVERAQRRDGMAHPQVDAERLVEAIAAQERPGHVQGMPHTDDEPGLGQQGPPERQRQAGAGILPGPQGRVGEVVVQSLPRTLADAVEARGLLPAGLEFRRLEP